MVIRANSENPSSPMQEPRPPQQVAIGTIDDALSYVEAARILDEAIKDRPNRYSPPIYFLLAHAMELVLKAHLYSHGTNDKALKSYDVRHDLSKLLEMAQETGFQAADDSFVDAVEWLSPYHKDHSFRYRKTGLLRLPLPHVVAQIVAETAAGVKTGVRARYFAMIGKPDPTLRNNNPVIE